METVDAYKILRAYDIISQECDVKLGIHYYDPNYPHLNRVVLKSTAFPVKQGEPLKILEVIKDALPPNLIVHHVYAFIDGRKLLIFDDSSFLAACILCFQEEPKPDTCYVFIGDCAREFDNQ